MNAIPKYLLGQTCNLLMQMFGTGSKRSREVVSPTTGPCPQPASRKEWAASLLVKPRLWKGACCLIVSSRGMLQQALPTWLPDSACSFACRGLPWHLCHSGWTAQCYQWEPKPFLVAGNNEMHNGMAGKKVAKR